MMGEARAEVGSEEGMAESQAGGTARLGWGEVSHSHVGPEWEVAGRLLQLHWGPRSEGRPHLGWLEVR